MPAERAGYTVTMFLIDISSSMGALRTVTVPSGSNGEQQIVEMTNLQWSLQFALLKIQEMIYSGRKTEQCGVILFGTEETKNIINESNGGYDHVTEYIPIGQPNANTLAKLQALQSSSVTGDRKRCTVLTLMETENMQAIDAIIVGIETQDRYLKSKKTWTRKMVLITDGANPMEIEDWELTVRKMNSLDVMMTIVGVDFDDEEYGYAEEGKSDIKLENEKFFHKFIKGLKDGNGILGTADFVLQECVRPETKVVKSALLGTLLRIGDVDTRSEEAIEVPVKMSRCTAVTRPPSMKKFAKRAIMDINEDQTIPDEEEERQDVYAQLLLHTDYYISNDTGEKTEDKNGDAMDVDEKQDEDTNKTETETETENENENEKSGSQQKINESQLIRGFKYGASYVPCPDGTFPRLSTRKGIDICGFFPETNLRRDLALGEVQYVWADPSSGHSQIAFSSMVQAMLSQGVVAIARWVSRDDMDPKMGLLIPRDSENVDCFLWLQMPFADDVRKYSFPSLEHLVSQKGETITDHPFIPTTEQMDAMDRFVDAMDLMQAGDKDESGQRMPWYDPRYSYNPAVHRIKQALFHAAVVNDLRTNPLPPPHPEITKYLEPPRRVLKNARDTIQECKSNFKIRQVPKRIGNTRREGRVRVDDDDDEPLLLDQTSLSKNTSQSQPQEEFPPSATLVDPDKGSNDNSRKNDDVKDGLRSSSIPSPTAVDHYEGKSQSHVQKVKPDASDDERPGGRIIR